MSALEIALAIGVAVFGVINTWLLFYVQTLNSSMKELRAADTELGKELAKVNVLVAGQYVTRSEFQEGMRAQTATLLSGMERILGHHTEGAD